MSAAWEKELREAEKTALVKDNRRKIHFVFKSDKSEMVEEYDMACSQLFVRKWRKPLGMIGHFGDWEFEVGEPIVPMQNKVITDGLFESTENPVVIREDNQKAFQFRIRNLPWPKDNYGIALNPAEYCIVVSTKNKKYYKKLFIPDLKRLGVVPTADNLKSSYSNNTLIVQYEKTKSTLEFEHRYRNELMKMKAVNDGDVDHCLVS